MVLAGYWLLAILRHWRLFRVSGNSMSPTLLPGDWVWVDPKSYRHSVPHPNQIVVLRHPYRRDVRMVKRVVRASEGSLVLHGDNPAESTDSQILGAVPASLVVGKVRLAYRHDTHKMLRLDL
jgi:nickel-type superoxide dismutase maturation protease